MRIHIIEKCLQTLDQEPGGRLCALYIYYIQDEQLEHVLLYKNGTFVKEVLSKEQLTSDKIADLFKLPLDVFNIERNIYLPGI